MDATHQSAGSVRAAAVLLAILAMAFIFSEARGAEHSEDAVKAAYLYRFAGYIDWPDRGSAETPFIIDVLSAPGIARELRRLVPGHPINGQMAKVVEIADVRDLGNAQIVFVAAGHADLLRSLLPQANAASILLVTDEEGGLSSGSTLNLLTVDRNVRFEVSLTAAQRWGLKISSELLGVAIRVQGRGGQSFLGCYPATCGPRVARERSRSLRPSGAPSG
jgi:YfiR/HmsC-like